MTRVLVGTYAAKGGPGLTPIVRGRDGWRMEAPLAHVRDASWALASPLHALHYVVNEMANTVAVHRGGEWTKVADVPSGGEAPCHLALSPDGQRLAVTNYGDGRITLMKLDGKGLPVAAETWPGSGDGPDAERQAGPHAHWVGFAADGSPIRVDLGADRIIAGVGKAQRALYIAPRGSGPRHLAFHPDRPLAYLVSELASTLTVLRIDAEPWVEVAILSTLPAGIVDSLVGAIARRLFVTNRGHDSVVTFAIETDGMPRLLRITPSSGASPRFVLPLADQVLVAHEEDGGVTIFARGDDGAPEGTPQRLAVPGAAFLMIDGD